MQNNFNSFSPLTTDVKRNPTDAQTQKFKEFSRQQGEGYQIEILQLQKTVENLTNEITKIKEAHSLEVPKNDAVSKALKEAHSLELAKKDDMIKTLTEVQNTNIKKIQLMTDEAVTMTEKQNLKVNELTTKTVELKEHVKSIPTRIQEMKEEIITSNEELKNDIQDITDAVLRTKLDEFEVNIFTEVSKIVSNIQIPTPTPTPIDVVALENNIIIGFNKHEADYRELLCKIITIVSEDTKKYIDAIPRPTTETPNMQEFSDKIMLEFDKKLERQLDLMNKRFDSYDEKMELLMKIKEAPIKTSKPTINLPSDIPLKPTIKDTINNTEGVLKPTIDLPSDIPLEPTIDLPSDIPLKPTIKDTIEDTIEDTEGVLKPTIDLPSDIPLKHITEKREKIVTYLKKNTLQTNKQISEALNLDESNTSRTLKTMVKESVLIKDNKDRYFVK